MGRGTLLAWAGIAALYLVLAAGNPMSTNVHGDGYYTYLWARTIAYDGDLDFHEDYRICGDPWGLAHLPIGDDQNHWQPGAALFWVPILLFDRLTHHPALDYPDPRVANACEPPLSKRAVRGSQLAGLLVFLLGFLVARRYFSERVSLFGAAGIALLSGLTFYSTIMLSYNHAASSFTGALVVWLWDRYRGSPSARGWALQGAAVGLAMLTRAQNAIVVLLPFLTWVAVAWPQLRERRWRPLLRHVGAGFLFAGLMILVFSPQLYFWKHSTGSFFAITQGEHYMRWGSPQILKVLFSANGLIPWAPAHLPAILGLIALAARRNTRAIGLPLLLLFCVDTYVVSCAYDWAGSVGFPGRRFDLLAGPFMIGLASFGHEVWRWQARRSGRGIAAAALVALAIATWWNLSVVIGVARQMRTDTPRSSASQWHETYGQTTHSVWQAIGNPLTWPASIPFALRFGTHPRRWDVVGGSELFHHDERSLARREEEGTLDLSRPDNAGYLDGHASEEVVEVGGVRGLTLRPGSSRLFLPLHWPEAGALEVHTVIAEPPPPPGSPPPPPTRLWLNLNGVDLGGQTVPRVGRPRLLYRIPRIMDVHRINEVWIWVEGSSILLSKVRILDTTPPPSAIQAERNRRLLEERRRAVGGSGEASGGGSTER